MVVASKTAGGGAGVGAPHMAEESVFANAYENECRLENVIRFVSFYMLGPIKSSVFNYKRFWNGARKQAGETEM